MLKSLLAAFLAGATPALADCNTSLIRLTSWTATPADEGRVQIETNFTYDGTKPLRMLDAIVIIEDVLGESITVIGPDRDIDLTPGQAFSDKGLYGREAKRLLTVNKADIVMKICVRGVVYADGTVAQF